jgi:hypothetical protein
MCKGGYNYNISNSEVAEAFNFARCFFYFVFILRGTEK